MTKTLIKRGNTDNGADIDDTERISVAAYFLAEKRDFAPGNELSDWLEAEKYIQSQP